MFLDLCQDLLDDFSLSLLHIWDIYLQKKLTKKRFKELILAVQNKSMNDQCIALDKFITEYRNELEQIDDILVMGVKV